MYSEGDLVTKEVAYIERSWPLPLDTACHFTSGILPRGICVADLQPTAANTLRCFTPPCFCRGLLMLNPFGVDDCGQSSFCLQRDKGRGDRGKFKTRIQSHPETPAGNHARLCHSDQVSKANARRNLPYTVSPKFSQKFLSEKSGLRCGASIDMKMNIYGGRYNPLALLRSSAHPLEAGVAREAISCFERF